MSERIVLRTGEALVEGSEDYLCAEPEVVIGELDGPVGHALANLIGNQVKGHTRVFALLSSDVQVRPATVMVSKVTVKSGKYTNILMGTVQSAIAHGVLDAVRAATSPRTKSTTWESSIPSGSTRRSSKWITSTTRLFLTSTARRPPWPFARRCATSQPSTGCWTTKTTYSITSTSWG